MTNEEAIKKMQAVKAYMIAGNPIWSVTEMGEVFDIAIEALENNDKLAEDLQSCLEMYKKKKAEAEALKQTTWIPCSERLPSDEDYDETFTVTIQCEHYDGWDDYVTGYADWTPHGWDIQSYYMGQIKVVAWMPLPEPYKEETK